MPGAQPRTDLATLRARLSLTQAQFAALMGVTQAAVSQYEAGTREPVGDVRQFYLRLRAAVDAPVVPEMVGRRPTTMPANRWERVIDPGRVESFQLPVRLDWSPRIAGPWRYDDEAHRRDLYRLLLDVGDAVDVMTYIDVDELAAWSGDLLVASDARAALDRLVARTAAPIRA
ncbi:hypothetical protein BH24ACT5_BH24ACT5_12060 [soil metagenome]